MRAAQIVVGDEYLACYYPDRHNRFDLGDGAMDERAWQHFEDTGARVRVLERESDQHSSWRCETLSPQTGEPGGVRSFHSAQILAGWDDWRRAFLDHHQRREDAEHERHLRYARSRLAEAEQRASEWRRCILDASRLQLVDARAALDVGGLITEEAVRRYIDLQHPGGNPYQADIVEASERLSALEDDS